MGGVVDITNNIGLKLRRMSAERLPNETHTLSLTLRIEVFAGSEALPADEQELVAAAREAMSTSHSPYSHFTVGAAVRLRDGTIVTGSNQENASYGLTMCAERSALFAVGSQGRKGDVTKIAIIGTGADFETTEPVSPCGGCRQVIKEYEDLSGKPLVIIMSGSKGRVYRVEGIEGLLPLSFGPRDMGVE